MTLIKSRLTLAKRIILARVWAHSVLLRHISSKLILLSIYIFVCINIVFIVATFLHSIEIFRLCESLAVCKVIGLSLRHHSLLQTIIGNSVEAIIQMTGMICFYRRTILLTCLFSLFRSTIKIGFGAVGLIG